MLFALGFVVMFSIGGLSGVDLANALLDKPFNLYLLTYHKIKNKSSYNKK